MCAEYGLMPQISLGASEKAGPVASAEEGQTLDPSDWEGLRAQAHRMLDDILNYTRNIRQRAVWQPIPDEVRQRFRAAVPVGPSALAEVHQEFMSDILPFAAGNVHPGFMGWVHGGGTPVGTLAEMLAAGLNANLGGRDQIPIEVERQIARWIETIFGFPESAAGLFVTGTSMANFIAVVIARDAELGSGVRSHGVAANEKRLTAYASTAVHGCVAQALDLCGLGTDRLRLVPTDHGHRMDLEALENAIQKDRAAGFHPFLVVGTAGTVDTGAIDDLARIADIAHRHKLWFHVDGAYGALAMLAPELAAKLHGVERADSLAFDFHKWGQVPYDAGFLLVRDGTLQHKAFAASSAYLKRETRGLAAGPPWPCDYGPDLSRGFRALKTWFTLKVYGTRAIGATIARTCELARYLGRRIAELPELELLAPIELNIVCFRYRAADSDAMNRKIVVELQESGAVAPSTTLVDGRLAIRVAIVNHRTGRDDIDRLLNRTLELGRRTVAPKDAYECKAPGATKVESGPRVGWERALQELEKQLASNPSSIELRLRRAALFSELGRPVDARNDYMKVLEREPHHLVALNDLGCALMATGHRKAASIAYKEAVARHPNDVVSRANLGHLLLEEGERLTVREQGEKALELRHTARALFEDALRIQPDFARAHEGLAYVLADLGDEQKAEWHRREAFCGRSIIQLPYRGEHAALPVLLLLASTGGNVRLQKFLDEKIFQTYAVLADFYDPKTPLPVHRLVVNAIGDAEISSGALLAAQSIVARTTAPVINPPAAVLATGRSNNAKRLSRLPGVVTPISAPLSRKQLAASDVDRTLASYGLGFPLLVRTPGFHTGLHFLRVEGFEALPDTLAKLPGEELVVLEYLDSRGPDGRTRKYRVMAIDGQLYPLHCAISNHWKIHYFSAEMADNPAHRAEDQAFLENMPGVLGPLAMKALEGIQSVLGLDYAGIDFGVSAQGEVLLFEANATMVVNPPEPDERWSYRRPAYERISAAIQKMLMERAVSSERSMATQPSKPHMPEVSVLAPRY